MNIKRRGFTLFFAMLVGSIALAVGLAIFDLTLRELDLSAVATQSQYAIYAADTGAECALYWDSKYVSAGNNNNGGSNSAFPTSTLDTLAPVNGILCNGEDIAAAGTPGPPITSWQVTQINTAATTTFTMSVSTQSLTTGNPTCATVVVVKSGSPLQTNIISHGYNTCAVGAIRLERIFQVSY